MQRAWLREFNSLGLQLRPQAAKLVTSFLTECDDPQRTVEALVEHTKAYFKMREGAIGAAIDSHVIQSVIECMEESAQKSNGVFAPELARTGIETMDLGDGIQVYNVLTDMKHFCYQNTTREWVPSNINPKLFPNISDKTKIYAERYQLLWQRLRLEGSFVPESEVATEGLLEGQRVITPVESLVGNPGRKLTFGLLSRIHGDGTSKWSIEDLNSYFPVDLKVEQSDHLITDGSFVLAEAMMIDGRVRISHLDVPAAVSRQVSAEKDQIPPQVFGGNLSCEQLSILEQAEPENSDAMYVVLAEVHLDDARVLEKISDMFHGYEGASPPTAYVFMGNFSLSPFIPTASGIKSYREGFERLKLLMESLPNHAAQGTRYIFIPGPRDPGSSMLPRPPLTSYLTMGLDKAVPGVILATNPCRVRHMSRQLVFFRHDIMHMLRLHEVVPLRTQDGTQDPSSQHVREEMARLLLDQAHLVPLPLEQSNVHWSLDHALRLYPLPTAVFVGGASRSFECVYQQCHFCSVGPVIDVPSFYAYYPVKEVLEPCELPNVG